MLDVVYAEGSDLAPGVPIFYCTFMLSGTPEDSREPWGNTMTNREMEEIHFSQGFMTILIFYWTTTRAPSDAADNFGFTG